MYPLSSTTAYRVCLQKPIFPQVLFQSPSNEALFKPILLFVSLQLIESREDNIKQFESSILQANGKVFCTVATLSKYMKVFGFRPNRLVF